MKYLIASDLHGSAENTARLMERFDAEKAGQLWLLGDILGYGDSAAQTAALLNARAGYITAVRGNCDRPEDREKLAFALDTDCAVRVVDGRTMFLTHGHIFNPLMPPELEPGSVMLMGHSHVPSSFCSRAGIWFLNPGSVSRPRQGSPRSYMTLEDGVFLWKTLEGEIYRELSPD